MIRPTPHHTLRQTRSYSTGTMRGVAVREPSLAELERDRAESERKRLEEVEQARQEALRSDDPIVRRMAMTSEQRDAEDQAERDAVYQAREAQRRAEEADVKQERIARLRDHLRSLYMPIPGATAEGFEDEYPELLRRWLADVASGRTVPPVGLGDPVREETDRLRRLPRYRPI